MKIKTILLGLLLPFLVKSQSTLSDESPSKTPFFYLGLGIGYFRRYGYYSLPEASKNYTVNFGLTISQ